PRIAYPGHGEPIHDPAGRARELIEHHRRRLDETAAALRDGSAGLTPYEISLRLFGHDLPPTQRRFAGAETPSPPQRLRPGEAGGARRSRRDRYLYWSVVGRRHPA